MTHELDSRAPITVLIAQARSALAQAKTVPEARWAREMAGALADLARRRQRLDGARETRAEARAAEVDALELRLQAMRREGQLLAEMTATGQRAGKGDRQMSQPATFETLRDLGYENRDDPARAMQAAQVAADIFAEYVARARDDNGLASWAGLIRYAADRSRAEHTEAPPLPTGQYATIVADPPWPMSKSARIIAAEQGNRLDYPTLTVDQIAALAVEELAAADSHLYLWTTNRFLQDALDIAARWGFTYHCLLTWVKPSGFTPFSWMFNTEHVIFAYRGRFHMERKGLPIGFAAPATGHSIKPDVFYDLAEQASSAPRVELYARQHRQGWDVWGDELVTQEVAG